MRVLITGGAGRLGLTICKAIMQEGLQVRIFDLDNARNRKSVKAMKGKAEVFWGDITRPESVRRTRLRRRFSAPRSGSRRPTAWKATSGHARRSPTREAPWRRRGAPSTRGTTSSRSRRPSA